jgi:hypothetical protein
VLARGSYTNGGLNKHAIYTTEQSEVIISKSLKLVFSLTEPGFVYTGCQLKRTKEGVVRAANSTDKH